MPPRRRSAGPPTCPGDSSSHSGCLASTAARNGATSSSANGSHSANGSSGRPVHIVAKTGMSGTLAGAPLLSPRLPPSGHVASTRGDTIQRRAGRQSIDRRCRGSTVVISDDDLDRVGRCEYVSRPAQRVRWRQTRRTTGRSSRAQSAGTPRADVHAGCVYAATCADADLPSVTPVIGRSQHGSNSAYAPKPELPRYLIPG